MFSKFYVRKLSDTIISHQPLSPGQLYFLVSMAAEHLAEHDDECYYYLNRAKLSLLIMFLIKIKMEGGE